MAAILIIDDEPLVRHLIETVLARTGHQVVAAADGVEAAHRMAEQSFDLVVTDLVMPEREGIETIIEIRRTAPATRILAISGSRSLGGGYLESARMLGAAETLEKPFSPEQLTAAVERILRLSSS